MTIISCRIVNTHHSNENELLLQMVVLKHKFKLRFFIDESVSFGTLGDHGKGITEYAGLELNDIDLIMATLEYSAGSIGGFCVGTTYVVEHQGTRCFLFQN